MAMSTSSLLGVIGLATLSVVTAIQHVQLSAMRGHVDQAPQIAVTDIDRLGVMHALSESGSSEGRQAQLGEMLNELAEAGYLVIDQKAALTAPRHTVITPEELLEAAGVSVPPPEEPGQLSWSGESPESREDTANP